MTDPIVPPAPVPVADDPPICMHVGGVPVMWQDLELYRGDLAVRTLELKEARLEFKGTRISLDVWQQVLAFMAWTFDTHGCEAQCRLAYDMPTGTTPGKWYVVVLPQEMSVGLHTDELPEHKDKAAAYAEIPATASLMATVHHHCRAGAFQSGTDSTDELRQNGLHITLGNMAAAKYAWHARATFRKVQYAVAPEKWFDFDTALLTQPTKAEFPEAWKTRVHKKVVKVVAYTTPRYAVGEFAEWSGFGTGDGRVTTHTVSHSGYRPETDAERAKRHELESQICVATVSTFEEMLATYFGQVLDPLETASKDDVFQATKKQWMRLGERAQAAKYAVRREAQKGDPEDSVALILAAALVMAEETAATQHPEIKPIVLYSELVATLRSTIREYISRAATETAGTAGAVTPVELPKGHITCAACSGSGAKLDDPKLDCPLCGGDGHVLDVPPKHHTCWSCSGNGKRGGHEDGIGECWTCNGLGYVPDYIPPAPATVLPTQTLLPQVEPAPHTVATHAATDARCPFCLEHPGETTGGGPCLVCLRDNRLCASCGGRRPMPLGSRCVRCHKTARTDVALDERTFRVIVSCPQCQGTGKTRVFQARCTTCTGSGRIEAIRTLPTGYKKCVACEGTNVDSAGKLCLCCRGTGVQPITTPVTGATTAPVIPATAVPASAGAA